MSLLEDVSFPRFWTGFCWTCFLDMCVGHVSWRQFLTRILGHISWTRFWDMRKSHTFENRTGIMPYETIQENTTTQHHHKENTAETSTVTSSWGSCLSPTGFDSPVLLFVFCFCFPLRGLNLSPHLLLLVVSIIIVLPGLYVAQRNNVLCWSILFGVSAGVSLDWCFCPPPLSPCVFLCLPCSSALFFCWGSQWQLSTCVNLGLCWCTFWQVSRKVGQHDTQ